jgi:glucokinase
MSAQQPNRPPAENMDHRRMRRHNSRQVLGVVRRLGPISRADITRHTPYSAPTVSTLVNGLITAGLVREEGAGKSSGGRKPQLVSFNARCGVVVGCNIDSDAFRMVLADMNGEWLRERAFPLASDTRPRPLLRRVADSARRMLDEAKESASPLLSFAVGVPGMTDVGRGRVIEAANLEGWRDVPAREILEERIGAPVHVENDVNLAAIGEQWRGLGRGVENFVFVSVGTGIGAGIIIRGRLHRGHRWHAGEISHLNVDFRDWATDYAAAGYLEEHLLNRARRRRGGALRFDEESVERLGAAVANIATLLDPEVIVFGGPLVAADTGLLGRVFRVASKIAPNCPELLATELGEDAPLLGSVRVALQRADEDLHDLMVGRAAAVA